MPTQLEEALAARNRDFYWMCFIKVNILFWECNLIDDASRDFFFFLFMIISQERKKKITNEPRSFYFWGMMCGFIVRSFVMIVFIVMRGVGTVFTENFLICRFIFLPSYLHTSLAKIKAYFWIHFNGIQFIPLILYFLPS